MPRTFQSIAGGVLLSHTRQGAVPSALEGLASGFGTGPGVTPPLSPPTNHTHHTLLVVQASVCYHPTPEPVGVVPRPSVTARPWPGVGWLLFRIPDSECESSRYACEQATRLVSTGPLHLSPSFHIRPINPLISWQPYPHTGGGRPHLGTGFPLRCFQRLSLPNVANQPCPWQDNWHTRGPSVPVLSY